MAGSWRPTKRLPAKPGGVLGNGSTGLKCRGHRSRGLRGQRCGSQLLGPRGCGAGSLVPGPASTWSSPQRPRPTASLGERRSCWRGWGPASPRGSLGQGPALQMAGQKARRPLPCSPTRHWRIRNGLFSLPGGSPVGGRLPGLHPHLGQRAPLGPAPRPSPPDGRLSSLPPSAPATFPSPCPFLGGFPKQRWAPGRPGTRVVNLQATRSTILQPTPVSAAEGPLNTCRDRPPPDRDSARRRLSATHAPDVEPAARRGSGLLEVSEPARGGALGHRHTLRSGPEHAPAIVPKTRPRPGPRCLTDTGRPRGSPQARPRPAPGAPCCST